MKKTLLVALMAILILVLASATAAQSSVLIAEVDLSTYWDGVAWQVTATTTGGATYYSFYPATHYTEAAVAYYSGIDPDTGGYCEFGSVGGYRSFELQIHVLHSGPEDNFYVQINQPNKVDSWRTVYTYTADGSAPVTHSIDKFPFGIGKGQGKPLSVRIVAADPTVFAPYGHVAVDWVRLYGIE